MLKQINKYPIKGLVGQSLDQVELTENRGIVGDRQFALTLDDSLDGSQWKSSRSFLINAVDDGLLKVTADWASQPAPPEDLLANIAQSVPSGQQARLVERAPTMQPPGFWDYLDSQISVLNLQTLQAVSVALNTPLDIARFRGNLIMDDLPAWAEFGLAGLRCRVGEAELEFGRPARRCAATAVNPRSGERDIPVNSLLVEHFGHGYFGMYARVTKTGTVRCGDTIEPLGRATIQPQDAQVQGAGAYALWPKLAIVEAVSDSTETVEIVIKPSGAWPLLDKRAEGHLKLHMGPQQTVRTTIIGQAGDSLTLAVQLHDFAGSSKLAIATPLVVTGPYRR